MAFQSHVLENGQWVTRTSNLNDVLNRSAAAAAAAPAKHVQQPQLCGVLTRTVVQSPVAHWIVSVRLRSSQHNDVAFVGDHYVQISELRRDGQLHSISRKCDFGARIRNTKAIGSSPVIVNGAEYATAGFHPSATDDDMSDIEPYISTPSSAFGPSILPPQLLMVVLETGTCIFLFLRRAADGSYEFVTLTEHVRSARLIHPGFHLAVDPSSRYAVQACARDMFVVHELESIPRLNEAYARALPLKPVLSSRPRTVNGVIHTVEFLYPRPQDPQHIILLLIVIKDGVSRMITYDWMLGDDLREVFAPEKNGHALPPQHEMPLMVIPLTVRSAFLAVSEGEIAYCADALHGSPSFEPCDINKFPASEYYSGSEPPLWTAWSRPPRLYPYHRDRDFIYIAREDGVVIYLECDLEDIVVASFYHGTFCSVSTAFASLADEFHDGEALVNGETLVFGGDSGQGGVWRASPRNIIAKLCRIPNWAPAVDFVTTAASNRWDNLDGAANKAAAKAQRLDGSPGSSLANPDAIYAAAGRNKDGSIVEFRYGLQANIGIELNLDAVIRKCFMFQDNALDPESGYHLLLSAAGRTALIAFDSHFGERDIGDDGQDQMLFDLSSPTLIAAPVYEGIILQVTEANIVFVSPLKTAQFAFSSMGLGDAAVTDAALQGNMLAVISHTSSGFQLHVMKLNVMDFQTYTLYNESIADGDVTAFTLCRLGGKEYAVICLWLDGGVHLAFYCITDCQHIRTTSLQELYESQDAVEPLTSIVFVSDDKKGTSVLVAGSRNGLVFAVSIHDFAPLQTGAASSTWLGSMPVHVDRGSKPGSVFLCCDSRLVLASNFCEGRGFVRKESVWTVDAVESSKPSPAITSVTVLPNSLSGNEANTPLLLLTPDHVLLAELQPQTGPVQRHLPLGITPTRLLYSHVLKCLVVGAETADGATTLRFIDTETGEDLSAPANGQTKEDAEYISGLGRFGDRILCLEEWHFRSDSGHDHYYILVSTRGSRNEGKVLIVSPVQEKSSFPGKRGKIRFWTRYKLKKQDQDPPGPITAVTASGHSIVSSMGERILRHELNEIQKKITQAPSHILGAGPAWKLSILPGGSRMMALLKGDSVRIIENSGPDQRATTTHVDGTTRSVLDMLEVAGLWDEQTSAPIEADPPQSIVLVSDQNCSVKGLWIPWDRPGSDCEVLFETELPSSVRRLRLGRTLPVWSREERREKKFGILPASVDDAQILGMGIDGSMQHFTLLNLRIWRLLRFIQNIATTSPQLCPLTHVPFDGSGMELDDDPDDDPTPRIDRGLEMQVDGDMLQRCLDQRLLESLVLQCDDWWHAFVECLNNLDGGKWTKGFSASSTSHSARNEQHDGHDGDMNHNEHDERYDHSNNADIDDVDMTAPDGASKEAREYFDLAYEILEYYLVPVI